MGTETSLKLVWNQAQGRPIERQWIRYKDQFGAKKIIETSPNQTQRQVKGLTPGYEYTFEVVQELKSGAQEHASVSARMTSNSEGGGSKCVVCNSAESNDSCNTEGLSCDVAQNQMCAGGDRSQLVDVCVYCCEGDYCNVAGKWMD